MKSNHDCRRCKHYLEGDWNDARRRGDDAMVAEIDRQMRAGTCDSCQDLMLKNIRRGDKILLHYKSDPSLDRLVIVGGNRQRRVKKGGRAIYVTTPPSDHPDYRKGLNTFGTHVETEQFMNPEWPVWFELWPSWLKVDDLEQR